ncbi:MAG: DUF3237 domain-containing protein [Chitinophagaceae bacterium]
MNNYNYKLEHVFSFGVALGNPPEVIGPAPEGIRVNFYSLGGEITGPRLQGKCRPVGGDWLTLRTDGIGILDVRTTLETHDGALILVTYQGVTDLGIDGYKNFLEGNLPPRLTLHITPRCQTAHPDYQWLNRIQCLGIGEVNMTNLYVSYDVYAVK